jgi:hypothetical protein
MQRDDDVENDVESLVKLAAELDARGFRTQLFTPADRLPSLAVTNPQAGLLAETVIVGTQWYWWPWGQKIRPVTDAATAAEIVARVLATAPQP